MDQSIPIIITKKATTNIKKFNKTVRTQVSNTNRVLDIHSNSRDFQPKKMFALNGKLVSNHNPKIKSTLPIIRKSINISKEQGKD
jgi:hypothetical protein